MTDIKFINYSINENDQKNLDNIVDTIKQKPNIIKYKREAKFLKQFTLALMKQYKYNHPIKDKPVQITKKPIKKVILKPKNIQQFQQHIEPPNMFDVHEEHSVPNLVDDIPEPPHKMDVPEVPKNEDINEIPPPPRPEKELKIPLFN